MKNIFTKILFIALIAVGVMGFSGQAKVDDPLVVEFQVGPPLFSEANFLPGESVTRWVKVTNNSGQKQTIAIEAQNYSSPLPSDDLSHVLQIIVKEGSTIRYGPVLLSKFYEDSGQPGDEKVVVLSDLNNGQAVQYDITISFPPETANEWQGKTTSFDIVIGFKQTGETTSPSPSPATATYGVSGGGGSTGGWYFLTPSPSPTPTFSPQVAGESVSREGGESGRGGFITAEGGFAESAEGKTPGPAESAKPAVPAVAGESTCLPIPWWPFGYVLLLIILGTAKKMEKKVSSGGVILRITLLVIALLWWWFEPCGARFWVWPVLILVVFLISLRFYLKKVLGKEISA